MPILLVLNIFLEGVDFYIKFLELQVLPYTGFIWITLRISDNGTSCISYEFQEFLKSNGITHTLIQPCHPS